MYINFTFADGSNPYVAKNGAELFRMIKKYSLEQIGERTFHVGGEVVYLTYDSRKTSGREKAKAALREFAWQFSNGLPDFNYSYLDISEYQDFFTEYGKKYGLLTEFRENAIC